MREFYRRRSDTEQLIKLSINKVIEEVIELTRPRWRDLPQRQGISIQIQCELEPKPPLLLSDSGDLREALINLIFNAVDAMPQGGTITLITRSVTIFPLRMEIRRRPDGGYKWKCVTTASAWMKKPVNAVWNPFSPPKPNAAAPALVWPWFME